MAKQNYDEVLESQLGDMGGEEPQTLGKLKHKSVYGGKEELNDDERQSLDAFLNKNKKAKEELEAVEISGGWIPVNRELMGIRSLFYPAEWEFYVKPATMNAIKNWTAIDESRPDQVNKVFNEIIKQCVRIDTHSPQGAGWAQINSWDRFWFILKVREFTFVTGESKVEFDDVCQECGSDLKYTLTADALHYAFPDENLIQDYWTGTTWQVDPSEYDVDHEPITLYTPKLGKDDAIIEWATEQHREKKKLDENFIEFLVWMLDKPSRDMQMLDRQIQKLYKEYKSWDVDMHLFMKDVINNITINPSENLSMRCPHCGQETVSAVQFPDGVQALFGSNKQRKKFGSR